MQVAPTAPLALIGRPPESRCTSSQPPRPGALGKLAWTYSFPDQARRLFETEGPEEVRAVIWPVFLPQHMARSTPFNPQWATQQRLTTGAAVQAATAFVEVTYLDAGYGDLHLQYNAAAGDYQFATPLRGTYVQDTRGRRTAPFELPDADFRDAQNLGTDLRVASEPALQKHILSATVYLESPPSLPAGSLSTPAQSFEMDSRIVSSTVFLWYAPAGGQLSGPWRPLEGRENWTGQTGWWKFQVKQMMRAQIDVIYVHYVPDYHQQRINLFQALAQLREEGWDVPKVAAWLDPLITWHEQPKIDLATEAGKDELASHYIHFFEQYFSVNTDEHYLAQIDGRPVLNTCTST